MGRGLSGDGRGNSCENAVMKQRPTERWPNGLAIATQSDLASARKRMQGATMPPLEKFRAKVTPKIRGLLDFVWSEFLRTGKWPIDRAVYGMVPHPVLEKLLAPIGGSYLIEQGSPGSYEFQLQPLGLLCTTRGDVYLDWVQRYVAYARDVFYGRPEQKNITRSDVIPALNLTETEATELGRVLGVGLLWTQPGHASDYSTWSAVFPDGLKKIPPTGSIATGFKRMLARHYYPNMSVWAETRMQQTFGGPSPLESLFGSAPVPPRKSRGGGKKRVAIPPSVRTAVLVKSCRRCCVCYGLDGDLKTRPGQIAHLDRDRSNAAPDNLAWLCLQHHDQLDSRTSQSLGLTTGEVKEFRARLWKAIQRGSHVNNIDVVSSDEERD